jgi:hypothetical protein
VSLLSPADPVKPVEAIFSAERSHIIRAAAWWEEMAGPIDYVSPEAFFDHSDYYREEMGGPLVKRIFASEDLMEAGELVEMKVRCVDYEQAAARDGRRTVNLDPGYISGASLVLATGKPRAHRIYLGRGVWADLTLVYEGGRFRVQPWTYADYAEEAMQAALEDVRKKYLDQMKKLRRGSE